MATKLCYSYINVEYRPCNVAIIKLNFIRTSGNGPAGPVLAGPVFVKVKINFKK